LKVFIQFVFICVLLAVNLPAADDASVVAAGRQPVMVDAGLGASNSATVLYLHKASLEATRQLVTKASGGGKASAVKTAKSKNAVKAAAAAAANPIQALLASAAPNATVQFPGGIITADVGTTIVVDKPITIAGNGTTLVNFRFIFLYDVQMSNLNFVERDCTFHSYAPTACTPGTPLVTVGYPGYPIQAATITKVKMDFGRAYTGIAFGLDLTENVTIENFDVVDNEMSAITAFGGRNVRISNGRIKGGATQNVDDGVALYAVYDELRDVVVENVHGNNVFDVVGIGALMYRKLTDVLVRNVSCTETTVCVYVKAGDQAPVPEGYEKYSELSNLTIRDVRDSDPEGKRYLSSIWVYAKGGAIAKDIQVSEVHAVSRASTSNTARIRIFSDDQSTLAGLHIFDSDFVDPLNAAPHSAQAPGRPITEGVFLQSLGINGIQRVTFSGVRIEGATHYGIDSDNAEVEGLRIQASEFTNMNTANPSGPVFLIPYTYQLDGRTVNP
jgi:hypothetical protein